MNFSEARQKNFSDLANICKSAFIRYWRFAMGPALVIGVLVVFLATRLPDYYQAKVLLFIQPQKITSKIVETPTNDEMRERLEALVQEILSRPRLRNIIDRFNLYPQLQGPAGKEYAVQKFRKAIEINPVRSPTGVQLLQTFQLEFAHNDPKTTYEVTKALSNLFIDESVVSRQSEIQGTEEFLDSQLYEARKRLESVEQQVQEFARANFGKLPDYYDAAITRLQNAQQQLQTNMQLLAANETRRSALEADFNDAKREIIPVMPGGQTTSSDPAESLAQLEAALVVLTSKYSDAHPDVIATKNRIKALRGQLRTEGGSRAAPMGIRNSAAVRAVRRELTDVQAQITALNRENDVLKQTIIGLEKDIEQMPLKEQELLKIKRDYANVKETYEKLLAARAEAGLQASLTRSQKGTQFRIVEPAELPVAPAGPPRMIISAIGLLVGIVILALFPLGVFMLNSAYKFNDDLEEDLGLPVIGVVPPMETASALLGRRRVGLAATFASAMSLAAGLALILIVVG